MFPALILGSEVIDIPSVYANIRCSRSGENCSETRKLFSVTASCVQKKGLRMALYNFPAFSDATGGKGCYAFSLFFDWKCVIKRKLAASRIPNASQCLTGVLYYLYLPEFPKWRGSITGKLSRLDLPDFHTKHRQKKLFFFLLKKVAAFFSSWSYEGSDWWKVRN